MRLNFRRVIEGSSVCSINRDRPLNAEVRATDV